MVSRLPLVVSAADVAVTSSVAEDFVVVVESFRTFVDLVVWSGSSPLAPKSVFTVVVSWWMTLTDVPTRPWTSGDGVDVGNGD